MNHHTGHLSYAPSTDFPVEICGTPDQIAAVSGAVRAQDQGISFAEAREQAMDELRRLNKAERNRGRR